MGDIVQVGAIEIAVDGIGERVEGRQLTFVRRDEIERVAVAHGFTAERPLVALVAGALFIAPAVLLLADFVMSLGNTNRLSAKGFVIIGVMVLAALGALLLWNALRRGRYLRVDTRRGVRKLNVAGRVTTAALRDALAEAARRFGYDVDRSSIGD